MILLFKRNNYSATTLMLLLALALLFAGCGGGGGTTAAAPANGTVALKVTGTASEGALITGKTVKLKDATGKSAADTTTDATTGVYSVDVTNLTAPFITTVTSASGTTYVSLAQSAGTANINPITTIVIAYAAGTTDMAALFNSLTPTQVAAINTNYVAKSALVTTKLQANLPVGVTIGDYFTGTIVAGKGIDSLFDTYQIAVNPTAGITVKTKDAAATTILSIPTADVTAPTTQAGTYTVSGKITPAASGVVVGGLTVTLKKAVFSVYQIDGMYGANVAPGASEKETVTGADGSFTFSGVPSGSYTIIPSSATYLFNPTQSNYFTITDGTTLYLYDPATGGNKPLLEGTVIYNSSVPIATGLNFSASSKGGVGGTTGN